MKADERAADILRRCWWRAEEHPLEEHPGFNGLDVEIAEAIRAAVAEEREACALVADEADRSQLAVTADEIAKKIRSRSEVS